MTKSTKRKRGAQGRREEIVGRKFRRFIKSAGLLEGDDIDVTSGLIKSDGIDETSGLIKGDGIDNYGILKPGREATEMPWSPLTGNPLVVLGLYPAAKENENSAMEKRMLDYRKQ